MSENLTFCEHTLPKPEVENKIDPDDGNSWACDACRLPIFSTPFITTLDPNDHIVMHDQCAHDLPPKLEGLHLLHLREGLILHQDSATTNNNESCSRCHSMCGSKFYKCGSNNNNCGFQLDLACALSIKILHRSHRHRLTAIKGKSLLSSFICALCGTQHQPGDRLGEWGLRAYVCSACDFWIHPDCALLPNAIVIDNKYHSHPLLLTYLDRPVIIDVKCGICDHGFDKFDLRLYVCFDCRYYIVHIKCAVYSDPDHHISFKPVLIRDAQIPNLLRLPMPNENTSVMSRILMKINANVSDASTSTEDHQMRSKLLHEHPLILHHDHPADVRVCNACVHLISPSDPFYSCSLNSNELASPCRDFFLHKCCAHLPETRTPLRFTFLPYTLVSKAHTPFNMFRCECCQCRCNGFAYKWSNDYYMDVVCALMPFSIMHDAHAKSHILRAYHGVSRRPCNCCCEQIESISWLTYVCNNCRDFNLHAKCALLPETVTHKFDKHPIKLITTQTEEEKEEVISMFCEICEEDMDRRRWYYGCKECDQYFHIGCIPTLDELSTIKFGFTVRVSCHDCPVAAVRALSVEGYPCGHCREIIRGSNEIAFECTECYFRIHKDCAGKLLVSVQESN